MKIFHGRKIGARLPSLISFFFVTVCSTLRFSHLNYCTWCVPCALYDFYMHLPLPLYHKWKSPFAFFSSFIWIDWNWTIARSLRSLGKIALFELKIRVPCVPWIHRVCDSVKRLSTHNLSKVDVVDVCSTSMNIFTTRNNFFFNNNNVIIFILWTTVVFSVHFVPWCRLLFALAKYNNEVGRSIVCIFILSRFIFLCFSALLYWMGMRGWQWCCSGHRRAPYIHFCIPWNADSQCAARNTH